jgi:protein-disulfide isomerase
MEKQIDAKRRKKKHQKKKDFTPFIIIGVVAIIVLVVVILSTVKKPLEVTDPTFHEATITDGLTMGDPNAPVKIVEFADFQCPYCGLYWSDIEPGLISDYVETGKVFYTFSPFSFLGSYATDTSWDESVKSAEAAYCANDQGKFWEYRDYVFANQSGENEGHFSRDMLLEFAKRLDLDMTTFKDCLDSATYYQTVMDANTYAGDAGVNSTPTVLVNGEVVSISDLNTVIDAALQP